MIPAIILGSGNSGSSAILDYLWGRSDVADPLGGQEFRLLQERGGLSSLHRSLSMEMHPDDAMYAVIQFAKLASRLGADSRKVHIPPLLGYGFSRRIPGYDAAVANFLESITACTFGVYTLQDLLVLTTMDWLRVVTGKSPTSKKVVRRKPIPVPADQFLRHAQRLIARLFFDNADPATSVLGFDQAGSFWSPVTSTHYFGDARRMICVTRDPCDVYASQRRKGKYFGTAAEFAAFQTALHAHVAWQEWADERVLVVGFEEFVLNHTEVRDRVCRHLGLDPAAPSSFNPQASKKSIGRHRELLTPDEIAIIRSAPVFRSWQ
jgi:hypothetical protein